jgi:MFS family permease
LKDQRCWLIFLLLIVIDVYPIYLLNNFKVIFMPIFNDDRFLAVCITINTVANILGTFLWGYLAHKVGTITTVAIVVSFTLLGGIIGFFSRSHFAIILFIIVFGVGDRGMETIAGPALV